MLPSLSELSVKLALGDIVKRLQAPQNMKDLSTQARLLCTNSGLSAAEKLEVFYIDTDNEKIAIQDDSDLQMAYMMALTSDNRVKFMIATQTSTQSLQVFNSPVKVVQKEVHTEML
jgi:hypothetical protein